MSVPNRVVELLRLTYGEIPEVRLDTPLTILGFRQADAVILASLTQILSETPLTDRAFAKVQTVGDLAAIVENGP
jgi:20S proteasome alpha/beta subunit